MMYVTRDTFNSVLANAKHIDSPPRDKINQDKMKIPQHCQKIYSFPGVIIDKPGLEEV